MTWAAAGVAAIVFGLALPRAPHRLAVAWLCATVASLSKDEGLLTGLMILVLVSIRYLPAFRALVRYGISDFMRTAMQPTCRQAQSVRSPWTRQELFALVAAVPCALVMAVPGLAWALLVRLDGFGSPYFGRSAETIGQRLHPTLVGLADNLHILPVAAAVFLVGSLALRGSRTRLGLGNPGWLWLVVAGSLVTVAATYVFGALEISLWLTTSVSRTTIFAQLALYTDLAVWLVIALTKDEPAENERSAQHIRERQSPNVPTIVSTTSDAALP